MKKGDTATIRLVYSPDRMNKCDAVLRIVNTMVKEIFKISGKPLPSSKIEIEKLIKVV